MNKYYLFMLRKVKRHFLIVSSFLLCFSLLADPLVTNDLCHEHNEPQHQSEISSSNNREAIKLSFFNSSLANQPVECEESEDDEEEEKNELRKYKNTKSLAKNHLDLSSGKNLVLKQVRLRVFRPPIA